MDGVTLVCQQSERLFEANEEAVAQIKAIATAFVGVGVFVLKVQPLRDKPLSELGNLALEYRFGRQVDATRVIAPRTAPRQHNFRFHSGLACVPRR
jgi:hypothetical protein